MTSATVSDLIDLADEVAAPSGGTVAAVPGARARVRARARLATTLRDGKVVRCWRTVRADFRASWLWRNAPPSAAAMWARRKPAIDTIPGEHRGLYLTEVVWRTGAVVLLWPLFAYLWLMHRALTGIPTVAVTAALAVMWLSH